MNDRKQGPRLRPLALKLRMTYKIEAQPGISWDGVIASMKQRANKINFKFIGSNSLHREIEAITGNSAHRVEV